MASRIRPEPKREAARRAALGQILHPFLCAAHERSINILSARGVRICFVSPGLCRNRRSPRVEPSGLQMDPKTTGWQVHALYLMGNRFRDFEEGRMDGGGIEHANQFETGRDGRTKMLMLVSCAVLKHSAHMTPRPGHRGSVNLALLGSIFVFSATAVHPYSAKAGDPPLLSSDLPGIGKGKVEAYWVGPYVRYLRVSGDGNGGTVTWFTDDWKQKRQTTVSSVQPGFATTVSRRFPEALVRHRFALDFVRRSAYQNIVHGVNEDWSFVLPNKAGPSGYLTSTPDSRVFVHEFHPTQGRIALDVYVHGKLANTVGPFRQYPAGDVSLSDYGSAALIVWKDETERTARLVVLDGNGKISFRVDCDHPVRSPISAPKGIGALLRSNTGDSTQNTFRWYTREGKMQSLDIAPNPHCVGWIPETRKSLFSTSVGFEHRYRLIDWDTAKTLWEIPSPGDDGHALAIGLTPRLVVFAVGELYRPGPWRGTQWVLREGEKEWIRAFYAVSVKDGSLVARWQAGYPQRLCTGDRDSFLRLSQKLFFLTSDEIIELSEEEIVSKRNGWK